MSDDKTETMERPVTVDDVVNDALGSQRGVLVGRALDDKALLAKYEFNDLEVVFAMRDAGGEIIREREPCYELLAEGFYGNGLHGTWYQEGATIVFGSTPNEQMRPLNRAAGINYANWLESLPQNRTYIDIGDMSEAAVILAKDPRVAQMSQAQAQRVTIAVAEGLKLKRDPHARDLRAGDINRNFAPSSGGKSPPMLGAKMSDLSQIGPGMTRGVATVTGPGAGVRKAANPLGGPPPAR